MSCLLLGAGALQGHLGSSGHGRGRFTNHFHCLFQAAVAGMLWPRGLLSSWGESA